MVLQHVLDARAGRESDGDRLSVRERELADRATEGVPLLQRARSMTCPGCGVELDADGDNPQEVECAVCHWTGHPTEADYGEPQEDA